jgi:hypothetical protein
MAMQNGDADQIIRLVADYVEEELDRYLGMLSKTLTK